MSDLAVIFTLIFLAGSLAIYGVYWVFVFNRREKAIINRRLDLSKRLDVHRPFWKPCGESVVSAMTPIPFCVSSAIG